MSKLDDEIYKPRRSESYIPPYWEICKICRVPFKTDVFAKTCERCSVLLDERIRLFHSLVLRGFLFIIVYIGISLYWILYIIKYSSNYWFVLSVPILLLVIGGRIFYKLLYRLNLE
jgi:hypothetical protein